MRLDILDVVYLDQRSTLDSRLHVFPVQLSTSVGGKQTRAEYVAGKEITTLYRCTFPINTLH